MALKRTAQLKAELQSRGLRLETGSGEAPPCRKGGAGPAEGITLLLDGSPASVPFASGFVSESPFLLRWTGGRWALLRDGEEAPVRVALLPVPSFYGKAARDGTPFRKIALFHGADCLASTVLQFCAYWGRAVGCRFCGIGLSWASGDTVLKKEPGHLAEAARAAREDGARHVTLTAGSTEDRRLEQELVRAAGRAVLRASGLPVHVQLLPPVSRGDLESLRADGVASLGIHRESFDGRVLARVAPGKASIPETAFLEAWREAVRVFGRGQVSSFLLLGLGERRDGVVDGCRRLADLGVYPYLVPFRPIPGTPMAGQATPEPAWVQEICEEVAEVLEARALDWADVRAGCVRCRGCSALPDFQDARARAGSRSATEAELTCEVVRGGALLEASYAIRQAVFVGEQRIFHGTDQDEREAGSLHIVARDGNRCVGTVRITPLEDGTWIGSRLAVRPELRGRAGRRLVQRAEEEVLHNGGRVFVAHVQLSRVPFFERCGWRCAGPVEERHGRPHRLMAAAGPRWGSPDGRPPGPQPADRPDSRPPAASRTPSRMNRGLGTAGPART